MIPDQVMQAIHFAEFVMAKEKHDRIGSSAATVYPMKFFLFLDERALRMSAVRGGGGRRDLLTLLIYLSDVNKESYGFGYAKWRWIGYRSMRLLWGDQKLWEADLGIPRPGGEWFIVNLPALPNDLKTLSLRLRVEDHKYAKNNFEIAYVGPIRLIEVDRD